MVYVYIMSLSLYSSIFTFFVLTWIYPRLYRIVSNIKDIYFIRFVVWHKPETPGIYPCKWKISYISMIISMLIENIIC